MKNIHSIINVNNLLKKCITKIPGKENANLIDAYKMKIKFDKYTKNSHTNLHKATMLTKFIHRGDMKNSTYINKGGNKLYSSFSTSDVIKNIIEGKKKTGNCLGTSMACIYLLESNGIKTKLLNPDQHILISVKIENNYIPIETTITNGFNVIEKETRGEYSISKLESITLNAIFTAHQKKDDFKKTLKYIDESIKIDPNFSRSHYNKGCFLHKKNDFNGAIKSYTKSIKIDPNFINSIFNRGISHYRNKNLKSALKDIQIYSSYNKKTKKQTKEIIRSIKVEIIKEKVLNLFQQQLVYFYNLKY